MPKKIGILFMTVGAVLIGSALLLFLYNRYEDYSAGQEAGILLGDIRTVIEEKEKSAEEEGSSESLPTIEINGYAYIGYLSIPELELELPIMSEWDYERLKIAPCRQFGSSKTDNLVIAAHNYKTHFGRISSLSIGAEVYFTDMDGIENLYAVKNINVLDSNAVDAVQNSGHDLVLYTCTYDGTTRVVVFCDRIENNHIIAK